MVDLTQYIPIAQAISLLLAPHGEVVIHDLKSGKIALLLNSFSKRKVGDESLLEELKDYDTLPDVFPLYTKVNYDGRMIKSVTATLREKKGKPIGLLCINLDVSKFEEFQEFLGSWVRGYSQPEILFKDDWREKINVFVTEYLRKEGVTLKGLNKQKKQELIKALEEEGAFKAKNAASYVADVLHLSRATIYNYLKDIK